jgi:hypothetical protein
MVVLKRYFMCVCYSGREGFVVVVVSFLFPAATSWPIGFFLGDIPGTDQHERLLLCGIKLCCREDTGVTNFRYVTPGGLTCQ